MNRGASPNNPLDSTGGNELDRRLANITRTGRGLAALALAVTLALPASAQDAPEPSSVQFKRGDSNADDAIDIGDPVFSLFALFQGSKTIRCEDAADSNDDGLLDVSDPIHTLTFLFLGGSAPRAPGLVCGVDPTGDSLTCAAYFPCQVDSLPVSGQTEFVTPMSSAGVFRAGDEVADGAPGAPPGANPDAEGQGAEDGAETEREVEESDIYKIVGNLMLALNRYRGLQVIDISDLKQPEVLGSVPMFGYPREMYVRGDLAYVILDDYLSFDLDPESGFVLLPRAFYGSLLWVIDISEPRKPEVAEKIEIQGRYDDSRIVGDVLYLVSKRQPYYYGWRNSYEENNTFVQSIDISDPGNVHQVDWESFDRASWDHHISVTNRTIYLAQPDYNQTTNRYETRLRYVDISDPQGDIRVRGDVTAPGLVRDRWSMDEYQGVLRVATTDFGRSSDVNVLTYSVANPDSLSRLGSYTLHINESLTSARFDGPCGYLVTYRSVDPLFTFDLSEPSDPRLLGELVMSGWLDFMVPMGERLVALGHEDRVDPETGRRDIKLAVSLIDVDKDKREPTLLSRITAGEGWGWVPSERDDFAKVFRVLRDQGLIMFPFSSWDSETYRTLSGVQLIDLDLQEDELRRRGFIGDGGWVQRGIPFGGDTVFTLSNEVFQTLDISDRDAPELLGRVDLARNVQYFQVLPDGEHCVQLAGDWYLGDTELVVTTLDDPDAARPVSRVHLAAPSGRLFVNGSMAYVVSMHQVEYVIADGQTGTRQQTIIQVVDLSDPTEPVLRGSLELPRPVQPGYDYWYWGYGDQTVQVEGSTLVFFRNYYSWWWGCLACDAAAAPVAEEVPGRELFVVDLSRPDEPELASTIDLDDIDWAWGLKASGSNVYISTYDSFQTEDGMWMAKYFLHRFDVSDPAAPVRSDPVNIPGMFLDASPDGSMIYTYENRWDYVAQTSRNIIYALEFRGDVAELKSHLELAGYLSGVEVTQDDALVALSNESTFLQDEGGNGTWKREVNLLTVDLSNPEKIVLAGKAPVPIDWGYLRKAEGGKAFVGFWQGLFSYDITDIERPSFEAFFRTRSYPHDIVLNDDRAYLPMGYYGVQVLELAR